jgi:hypothetical protein
VLGANTTHENGAMFGRDYNHYAIEFAFKKAMNLDTMAVVHFAISACK